MIPASTTAIVTNVGSAAADSARTLKEAAPTESIADAIKGLQFVLEATGGQLEEANEPGQSERCKLIHKAVRTAIRTLETAAVVAAPALMHSILFGLPIAFTYA